MLNFCPGFLNFLGLALPLLLSLPVSHHQLLENNLTWIAGTKHRGGAQKQVFSDLNRVVAIQV